MSMPSSYGGHSPRLSSGRSLLGDLARKVLVLLEIVLMATRPDTAPSASDRRTHGIVAALARRGHAAHPSRRASSRPTGRRFWLRSSSPARRARAAAGPAAAAGSRLGVGSGAGGASAVARATVRLQGVARGAFGSAAVPARGRARQRPVPGRARGRGADRAAVGAEHGARASRARSWGSVSARRTSRAPRGAPRASSLGSSRAPRKPASSVRSIW